MAVDIRHASAADREALAELFHDMDRHYWNDEAPSIDEWRRFLDSVVLPASNSCEIVIAEEDGRPLSVATFAIVYPSSPLIGQFFLKEIYTRSEARSRGVGRLIMAYIAGQALRRGCARVDWVAEDARAMEFYDGLGARTLDKRVYYRLDGDALSALAGETHGQ